MIQICSETLPLPQEKAFYCCHRLLDRGLPQVDHLTLVSSTGTKPHLLTWVEQNEYELCHQLHLQGSDETLAPVLVPSL